MIPLFFFHTLPQPTLIGEIPQDATVAVIEEHEHEADVLADGYVVAEPEVHSHEPDPVDNDTSSEPVPTASIDWDRLAECESGGNWQIDTGNGYYGGVQFDKSSWDWAGGQQYAEYPHHATREQQIQVAEQLLSIHPAGLGAWPSCTKQLGMR